MLHSLVLIVGVVAVGSAALMARIGLDAGLSAVQLSTWRLTAAAVLLGAWALARRNTVPRLNGRQALSLVAAGVFLSLHFTFWFLSLEYLPVARSTLIVSTTPIWAGLLGLVVPSLRPARKFWVGLAVALVGLFLVTNVPSADTSRKGPEWVGDLLAAAGAIVFVPSLLLSKRVQREIGTGQAVTWIYTSAAATLWILCFAQGQVTIPQAPAAWGSAVGMAIVAQLGGHTIFNWALRHFTAGQVGTAMLLEPVVAAALAWGFLGERLTPAQGLGGALLLVGVGITLGKDRAEESEDQRPTP